MTVGKVRREIEAAAQNVNATAQVYKDGIAAEIEIDWDLVGEQIKLFMAGKLKGKRKLPGRLLIDPSYIAKG